LNKQRVEQILWPKHCVQNHRGAELHKDLFILNENVKSEHLNKGTPVIRLQKGSDSTVDSYSAFWDNQKLSRTKLYEQLKQYNVTDVYVSGIATDVCVFATAKHSLEHEFRTYVIEDACRGVDQENIQLKLKQLKDENCKIVQSKDVKELVKGYRTTYF